jgi:hypothetical protein
MDLTCNDLGLAVLFGLSGAAVYGIAFQIVETIEVDATGGVIIFEPGQTEVALSLNNVEDSIFEDRKLINFTSVDELGFAIASPRVNTIAIVDPFDYGDANAGYWTLAQNNGARHHAIGPTLGIMRDADADGMPSLGAIPRLADA